MITAPKPIAQSSGLRDRLMGFDPSGTLLRTIGFFLEDGWLLATDAVQADS